MCARRTERCRHFGWRAIEQAHVVSTPKASRAALPDLTFRCRHGWQYDRIFGWQSGPLTPTFPRQPPAGVLHRKGTAAADRRPATHSRIARLLSGRASDRDTSTRLWLLGRHHPALRSTAAVARDTITRRFSGCPAHRQLVFCQECTPKIAFGIECHRTHSVGWRALEAGLAHRFSALGAHAERPVFTVTTPYCLLPSV
jgi:hypothetical protein